MIRAFAVFAFGLAAVAALPAAAETVARIGLTAMPPERGNPYGVAGATANFVLPTMYDRLVLIDNDGQVQPQLAERWEMRDPLTWVFHLRRDVVFANGERLDAAGVKAVLDMIRADSSAASSGVSSREARRLAGIEVEDTHTLVLKLAEPNAVLPRHLYITPITAPAHLKKVGFEGLIAAPMGSGPFVAEEWNASKIVMRANPTSWRAPKVDKIEFIPLPEPTTRVQALLTGRIDAAIAIDPEQVPVLEAAGLRAHQRRAMRVLAIALQTLKEGSPFRDERVRQAVNYGVNRQAITDTLWGGLVAPASQATIPEALGYDPDLKAYPYDPDKAKALLAEAGYANGFEFTYEFPSGTLPSDGAIMQQIASDLGKIGVKMSVLPISYATFARYYTQGGWRGEALLADYPISSLDALRSFYRSAHSCDWPAPWFCDRAIQAVIDAAGIEPDLEKRTAMTREVLRHYHATAQSLLLFPVLGLDALGQRITAWEPWNDIIQYHKLDVAN